MYKPSISNNKLTTLLIITTAFILSACGSTSNQSISTNHIPKPNPNPKKFFNIPANHPAAIFYVDGSLMFPQHIILNSKGQRTAFDLNRLHNATLKTRINNDHYSLKIKTISDKTKTHKTTAIEGLLIKGLKPAPSYKEYKLLSVPLAFPHFTNTPSGALYSAEISQLPRQQSPDIEILYKKANELDFNALPNGKVQYQGIAISINSNITDFDIGSITLNADFDSKNISGNINRADGTQIELQQTSITNDNGKAKYSGNAKTNINNVDKTGTYEGNFFGHYLSRRASDTVGKVTFSASEKYLNSGFGAQRKRK